MEGSKHTFLLIMCKIYMRHKVWNPTGGGGARKGWRTEGVEHRMLSFIGCCVSSDAEFHRMLSFDRMLTAIGHILEKGSAEGVTYGCCVTSDAVFQRMLHFIGC